MFAPSVAKKTKGFVSGFFFSFFLQIIDESLDKNLGFGGLATSFVSN